MKKLVQKNKRLSNNNDDNNKLQTKEKRETTRCNKQHVIKLHY